MASSNGKNGRKSPIKITKPKFLKALEGTGGVKSVIAERLDCSWNAVNEYLKRCRARNLDCVVDAFDTECERVGDLAETCVNKTIGGLPVDKDGAVSIDEGPQGNSTQAKLAVDTSKWYLARKRKAEFGDKQTLVHEGGDKPIEVKSDVVVNIEDLPIETKKVLLAHLKEKKV